MSSLNKALQLRFKNRCQEIDYFKKEPQLSQARVFFDLISQAQNTVWGRKYSYQDMLGLDFKEALSLFQSRVPLSPYENLFPYINQVYQGGKNILWPGRVRYFAKSSGTTNDKSKIIPVTKDSLRKGHYQSGKDVLAIYLQQRPNTNIFSGKTLSISGSFSSRKNIFDIFCGDLSAILVKKLPIWARLFRAPKLSTALLGDWEKKAEVIAQETLNQNIVALAGVPSWNLVLMQKVLELSRANNILEVWPNMELFLHGGVSFTPYRAQFEKLIPKPDMNYLEIYNASEGFLAFNDDLKRDDMLLTLDTGIFYEFIPWSQFGAKEAPAWSVDRLELGKTYALAISTNSGLWRYLIGDTVEITSLNPLRVKVAGRTKHFINVFGEELMVSNTDEALKLASQKTGALVSEYTVAPIFMATGSSGAHEWLIEFFKKPNDMDLFNQELDQALKNLNSDYEAKRFNDLVLGVPKINIARSKLFYDWLKQKNKLGGQNKVPRLSNSREYLEEMLKLN